MEWGFRRFNIEGKRKGDEFVERQKYICIKCVYERERLLLFVKFNLSESYFLLFFRISPIKVKKILLKAFESCTFFDKKNLNR